jgi:hypothetical protein
MEYSRFRVVLLYFLGFSLVFTLLGRMLSNAIFVNLAKAFFFISMVLIVFAVLRFFLPRLRQLWDKKFFRIAVLVVVGAPVLLVGSFFFFSSFQKDVVHEGDLVLSGDQVMIVDNKRFTVKGGVVIQGNAVLKLINRASFVIEWSPGRPNELQVKDNARLVIEGSTIKGGAANVRDRAAVYLNKVSSWSPVNVWFNLGDSSRLVSKDSFVSATIGDNATIDLDGGSAFIELTFPENITAVLSLPRGKVSSWRFGEDGLLSTSRRVDFDIVARNTKFTKWGMTLSFGNYTFVDSPALVVGFTLDEPRDNPVVLTGLKKGRHYVNKTFHLGSKTTLLLLNSSTAGEWYFGTLGETNLTIRDSDLSDPVQLQDRSVVTFQHSVVDFLGAQDDATVYVRNSKVNGWVRAEGRARIFLENSRLPQGFPGQRPRLYEIDNGQIFIDGKPFGK